MQKLFTIALALMTTMVFGQHFEGKIVYRNTYVSKLTNVSSAQFNTMMGSTQVYLIKGGDYKSSTNGAMFQWQLYINQDNKLYSKMSNSETIFWNDGAQNPDKVLKIEVNPGVAEVLGYRCDEVIMTCQSGIQKYYFTAALGVDTALFTGHLYGNWYDYVKVAQALPLKSVVETPQFTLTSIATAVQAMELKAETFQLPANAKTAKSPF